MIRQLSRHFRASIVCAAELDSAPCNVDLVNVTLSEALRAVARRCHSELTRLGSVWQIGILSREDRAVLVRRVNRLDKSQLDSLLSTVQSDLGAAVAYNDGVIVFSDRVEAITRLNGVLDQLETVESAAWVVQLYLLSFSDSDLQRLGLDVTPSLDLSARLAHASGATSSASAAALALTAALDVSASKEKRAVVAQPLFIVHDGDTAKIDRIESIPIPRKTVSDQGTVSTSGFETIQAGLIIQCTVREQGKDSAKLSYAAELSRITGFVENSAPIVSRERIESFASIQSGGTYLLGSLERDDRSAAESAGLSLRQHKTDEKRVFQLWGRAYRIAAPPPNL